MFCAMKKTAPDVTIDLTSEKNVYEVYVVWKRGDQWAKFMSLLIKMLPTCHQQRDNDWWEFLLKVALPIFT